MRDGGTAGGRRWLPRAGIGWAVLAVLWAILVAWALRLGEPTSLGWVLGAGLHLVLLAAWPVVALAVVARRWTLAAAALATVAVQIVVAWPLVPRGGEASGRADVTVGSWNAYVDNDDPRGAARLLAADPPDVLVLQEFTPEVEAALRRAGLARRYPHRAGRSEPGTTGEAIWSRFPLESRPPPAAVADVLFATVRLPSGARLTVADVHAFGPQPDDPGVWVRTLHDLDHALDRVDGPWIALGDFNATSDHRAYRDLLHRGRRDAHEADGRGYARTWPASGTLPPLVLIDHAVVSPQVRVTGTREQTLPGSDHRMIRVDLAVARARSGR